MAFAFGLLGLVVAVRVSARPNAAGLREFGLAPEVAVARALENLRGRLAELPLLEHGPIRQLNLGDPLEASAFSIGEIWDEIAELQRGDLLVGIPHRDVPMSTDAAADGVEDRLRTCIEEVIATGDAHVLSSKTFIRRAGTWVVAGEGA